MRKNFVLDTNILLHDVRALYAFDDNIVNIPIYVIEEIDQFKKDLSELGRNAREVSREIDQYRERGSLVEGLDMPNGGRLRVLFADRRLPFLFAGTAKMDNWIVTAALSLKEREPDLPCVFITMDTNLRIRANAMGLKAEDYKRDRIEIAELYTGSTEIELPADQLDRLHSEGSVQLPPADSQEHFPNEYVIVREAGGQRSALARFDAQLTRIERLPHFKESIWGIKPKNKEQQFALDLLLRDEIQLVTLIGKAGTGKTLLALAAGLYKTTDESVYQRLLVSRPIFPLGRDIGYLPGDIDAKLNPWMQPIHDNVQFLVGQRRTGSESKRGGHNDDKAFADLVEQGLIRVEPLTYIRGRSIPNQYMIVDEAQNLTPHEVKTILTRVGHQTKIVFTGDPYQIDNPYVDTVNNGLTYLANRFRGEKIAGTVTLLKGERSALAELASNLL